MGKVVRLTESDLERIVIKVIQEQEMEEGIFDPIIDRYQGLKGVWRGEGYDYFKYLSSLRSLTKQLKKLDRPNLKVMNELQNLKSKVSSSKMPPDKKQNLTDTIDKAVQHFNSYSTLINTIEQIASQRLS